MSSPTSSESKGLAIADRSLDLRDSEQKVHRGYEEIAVFLFLSPLHFQGSREHSCSLCSAPRFASHRPLQQILPCRIDALTVIPTCALW
jgi:hypothetical protein